MTLSEVLSGLSHKWNNVKWATFHCNKGTADTNVSEQTQQDTPVYSLFSAKLRAQQFLSHTDPVS